MGTEDGLVHREVMELRATPAQVREFILTPERILDYYPLPVEGGVIEPGRAIWCRGEMGVSMLERVEDESSDDCVVVLVTTAIGLEPPYTRERITAATTFTMVEDWALAANGDGTTLTKSWRDIVTPGDAPFPIEDAVRDAAKGESGSLVEHWNEAARVTTAAEAKAVLSRWYDEMWAQKNFALVPEIAGPVYTRHEANGTRQVTAEEYRDALAGSLSDAVVEDLRYRLIAEGDRVVAIGTWKIDGAQWDWVQAFRVEGGKLVETWLSGINFSGAWGPDVLH